MKTDTNNVKNNTMNSDLKRKLTLYRISFSEYEKIKSVLGREPEGVEWALFSALWSEHCSYKSSKIHLKKFYNKNSRVLEAFGENAGVIDLGEGERVAFKMESHNHPSFIEPYQGAATGVGGILRDIFTMGARPIALANYLCFGEPQSDRMSALVEGVVAGISGYGNCVGVPNVTGQTEFDRSYNGNILVNAFALGLFEKGEKVFTSQAKGLGNCVVYVGAKTGKDGVHGASMASESFDEDSESKRPNIQVGDPFFEKLLIESCLEVMQKDLVEAIQDMGAAGLTSSSFEMASKGGVGLSLHLDKVPVRDPSMLPEEILLSESQERMLLICTPEKFPELQRVFQKWDLDAEIVGEVLAEKVIQLFWRGERLTQIDPDILIEGAPQYSRPYTKWEHQKKSDKGWESSLKPVSSIGERLLNLLGDIRAGSRAWVYRQYDQRVGARTVRDCSESIGIVCLPQSHRALGIVLGHRPYLTEWDASEGGKDSVIYPSLELSAKGFLPLAVTDCLNFGNPEKPEIMSQFVAAVEGMSEACEALDTPVISGNVSFYNETQGVNIISTPATGLVGLKPHLEDIPKSHFTQAGSQIYLLRCEQLRVSGQVSIKEEREMKGCGTVDPKAAAQFCKLTRELSQFSGVESTRVCGKFGLAYALARMCTSHLGFSVNRGSFLGEKEMSAHWFTETLYEVIFVVEKSQAQAFAKKWATLRSQETRSQEFGREGAKSQLWRLGEVLEKKVQFEGESEFDVSLILQNYEKSWEKNFEVLA